MRCPRCRGDDARLLGTLRPGAVFECLKCGEVWKEVRKISRKARRGRRTRRKEVMVLRVKITPTDLRALKRLRRVVLRRCRAALRRSSKSIGAPSRTHWGEEEVQKDG